MSAWPHGGPAVGDRASLTRTIEPDDILRFTAMSGDRNPLHYDEAAARGSAFGKLIVQGGVTSGILNALVAWAEYGLARVRGETARWTLTNRS